MSVQKAVEKYIPLLKERMEAYENDRPHWRIEVLVSMVQWPLRSLKHYIEDAPKSEISWQQPLVELRYPVEWNCKRREQGDVAPGGHIFGKITEENTAHSKTASKTLAQIMTRHYTIMALSDFTNGACCEKVKDYYTPILPLEVGEALNSIKSKRRRRECFEELVRPFSIGATRIDLSGLELKAGMANDSRVMRRIAESAQPMDISGIRITGDVNGRKIDMGLIFEIHPLIADYDQKMAYHPVVVGLAILNGRIVRGELVQDTPAKWRKKDRAEFWDSLLSQIPTIKGSLIPKEACEDSVILSVNSKLKIPAEYWRPENQRATIKRIIDGNPSFSQLAGISVQAEPEGLPRGAESKCGVCGRTHDAGFTQIETEGGVPLRSGILPRIGDLIHQAHEKGLAALSTKDDELVKMCGGYMNPCKAFDDLGQRANYKMLFDTRRRGFISLRGVNGINRNKSELRPE